MERTDQLLADLKECEAASLVGAHDAGVEMAACALQTARECGLRPEAALAAAWLAEHQLRRGESEKAAESARAALAGYAVARCTTARASRRSAACASVGASGPGRWASLRPDRHSAPARLTTAAN